MLRFYEDVNFVTFSDVPQNLFPSLGGCAVHLKCTLHSSSSSKLTARRSASMIFAIDRQYRGIISIYAAGRETCHTDRRSIYAPDTVYIDRKNVTVWGYNGHTKITLAALHLRAADNTKSPAISRIICFGTIQRSSFHCLRRRGTAKHIVRRSQVKYFERNEQKHEMEFNQKRNCCCCGGRYCHRCSFCTCICKSGKGT